MSSQKLKNNFIRLVNVTEAKISSRTVSKVDVNTVSDELETDYKNILSYLKADFSLLHLLGGGLKDDKNFVLLLVKEVPVSWSFVSKRLKIDSEVILAYCSNSVDGGVFHLMRFTNYLEDEDLVHSVDISKIKMNINSILKQKATDFFIDAIHFLDVNRYYKPSFFGVPKVDGNENESGKGYFLKFILPLIPEDVFAMEVENKGIRSVLDDEVSRRKLISIESKNVTITNKSGSRRRLLSV